MLRKYRLGDLCVSAVKILSPRRRVLRRAQDVVSLPNHGGHGVFAALALLALSGCAQMFTAKTTAYYKVSPDGTKEVSYTSDKEQIGLDASFDNGDGVKAHLKVDRSGTQESVIAATLKVQEQLLKMLEAAGAKAPGK